jgi:lysophospholipase L1-like esterase
MTRTSLQAALFLAAALAFPHLQAPLAAQETGSLPETKAPAPVIQAPSASEYNAKLDWPWLARFKGADMALAPPAAGENRVIFMGDSITQAWKIEGPGGSFPGKPYFNRGISGQTTPQMLLRFRQDVLDLKPKVVIILAGTNDIAGNTGPETLEQIEGYIASMAELATSHHIRVVLCSILPAFDYPWKPGMEPAPKIDEVNKWMKTYADDHGHIYVDYHSAMKDERDGLPATLSHDGVHPTDAGYAVMAPLAEAGIEKALKAGNRE